MHKKSYRLKKFVEAEYVHPAAFDTETDSLGGRILCATYAIRKENGYIDSGLIYHDDDFEILIKLLEKMKEFTQSFSKRKKKKGLNQIWYAHNAQYDWRLFFKHAERLIDSGFIFLPRLRTDTAIYELKIIYPDGDTIVMRDSMAIFSASLEKFTSEFAPDHKKDKSKGPNFEKGEIFNVFDKNHVDYAIRDSESLLIALENFQKVLLENYDVPILSTISSTALACWQRTLENKETFFNLEEKIESYCRLSYYGGLVFLTTTEQLNYCETYDVSSSYPAQMRKGVPGGSPARAARYLSFEKNGKPGFFDVTVEAPKDLIVPILPTRVDGNSRFPSGKFRTICTNIEIDFALKNGYRFIDCQGGIVFPNLIFPFEKFISKCESLRKKYKKQAAELVVKLAQNSVYGKFATSRIRTEIYVGLEPPDSDFKLVSAEISECKGLIWKKEEQDDDMLCRPDWAAWITANARLTLLKAIYKIGPEACVYGDTDSITVRQDITGGRELDLIEIGPDYGKFQKDKSWKTFRAIAPKVYAGEKKIKENFEFSGAAKGMPKSKMNKLHYQSLFDSKHIELSYLSLASLTTSIKRGITEAKIATRKSTDIRNSKNWEIFEDGKVRARKVEISDAEKHNYSGFLFEDVSTRYAENLREESEDNLSFAIPLRSETELERNAA